MPPSLVADDAAAGSIGSRPSQLQQTRLGTPPPPQHQRRRGPNSADVHGGLTSSSPVGADLGKSGVWLGGGRRCVAGQWPRPVGRRSELYVWDADYRQSTGVGRRGSYCRTQGRMRGFRSGGRTSRIRLGWVPLSPASATEKDAWRAGYPEDARRDRPGEAKRFPLHLAPVVVSLEQVQ
jgi:hypothetical protein